MVRNARESTASPQIVHDNKHLPTHLLGIYAVALLLPFRIAKKIANKNSYSL